MGHNFPCKDCIVIGICSKPCSTRKFKVSSFILREKVCIDCGGTEYYENIHTALYYMVCADCMSTYFISDNLQKGGILRSQTNKSTYIHISEPAGEIHPKRLFKECTERWKKWKDLK